MRGNLDVSCLIDEGKGQEHELIKSYRSIIAFQAGDGRFELTLNIWVLLIINN